MDIKNLDMSLPENNMEKEVVGKASILSFSKRKLFLFVSFFAIILTVVLVGYFYKNYSIAYKAINDDAITQDSAFAPNSKLESKDNLDHWPDVSEDLGNCPDGYLEYIDPFIKFCHPDTLARKLYYSTQSFSPKSASYNLTLVSPDFSGDFLDFYYNRQEYEHIRVTIPFIGDFDGGCIESTDIVAKTGQKGSALFFTEDLVSGPGDSIAFKCGEILNDRRFYSFPLGSSETTTPLLNGDLYYVFFNIGNPKNYTQEQYDVFANSISFAPDIIERLLKVTGWKKFEDINNKVSFKYPIDDSLSDLLVELHMLPSYIGEPEQMVSFIVPSVFPLPYEFTSKETSLDSLPEDGHEKFYTLSFSSYDYSLDELKKNVDYLSTAPFKEGKTDSNVEYTLKEFSRYEDDASPKGVRYHKLYLFGDSKKSYIINAVGFEHTLQTLSDILSTLVVKN